MAIPISERVILSKQWHNDKRKRVKLVELVDRLHQKWYIIMIGSKLKSRTQSLSEAKQNYQDY